MTMEDYFRYLNRETLRNEHFASQLSLCNPCLSKIEFIGRTETHDSDLDFIVNNATDFHRRISYHGGNGKLINRSTKDEDKFKTLTLETVLHFIWTFRHDYLAFGYNPYHAIGKVVEMRNQEALDSKVSNTNKGLSIN